MNPQLEEKNNLLRGVGNNFYRKKCWNWKLRENESIRYVLVYFYLTSSSISFASEPLQHCNSYSQYKSCISIIYKVT